MEDDKNKLFLMSEEITKVGESVTKALRSSKAIENTTAYCDRDTSPTKAAVTV